MEWDYQDDRFFIYFDLLKTNYLEKYKRTSALSEAKAEAPPNTFHISWVILPLLSSRT